MEWTTPAVKIMVDQAYSVLAFVSVIMCFFVILAYSSIKQLRKHPNSIVLVNGVCDFLYSLMAFVAPYFHELSLENEAVCKAGAFIYHFLIMSSVSWNFIISLNLFFMLRNPFGKTEKFLLRYHLYVWGTCVISSIIVVTAMPLGVNDTDICWIVDRKSELIFNIPLSIYLLMSVMCFGYSVHKLRSGLEESLQSRLQIIVRMLFFTFFYVLCWLGPMTHSVYVFVTTKDDSSFLIYIATFGESMSALTDSLVFLFHPVIYRNVKDQLQFGWFLVTDFLGVRSKNPKGGAYLAANSNGDIEIDVVTARTESSFAVLDRARSGSTQVMPSTSTSVQMRKRTATELQNITSPRYLTEDIVNTEYHTVDAADIQEARQAAKQNRAGAESDEEEEEEAEVEFDNFHEFVQEIIEATSGHVANNQAPDGTIINIDGVIRRDMIHCIMIGINETTIKIDYVDSDVVLQHYSEVRKHKISRDTAKADFLNLIQSAMTSARSFTFIEYAPLIFKKLRDSMFTMDDYLRSFSPDDVLDNFIKENFSEGASGSFFCRTCDNKFIIKTVTDSELALLLDILQRYYTYVVENPDTLLTKFYGVYSITMYGGVQIKFVVMSNVFDTTNVIHDRYDLKGSWINRSSKGKREKKSGALGLDSDLTEPVLVGNSMSRMLLRQIIDDSNFLCSVNIMDYSMLLGIHYVDEQSPNGSAPLNQISMSEPSTSTAGGSQHMMLQQYEARQIEKYIPFWRRDQGGIYSTTSNVIYYVGIIDILQEWNLKKKAETFWKTFVLRRDKHGISSQPPDAYARRFQDAMANHFQ